MTTATPALGGIVWGIPAVADPVSEFFRSLRFLLFASRSEDGGKAQWALKWLHANRPGIYVSPSIDDIRYAACVGDVCREMVVGMAMEATIPSGHVVVVPRKATS